MLSIVDLTAFTVLGFIQEIKDKFGSDIEKMAQGEYDSWLGNTYSSLAAVIIMDQFSR